MDFIVFLKKEVMFSQPVELIFSQWKYISKKYIEIAILIK